MRGGAAEQKTTMMDGVTLYVLIFLEDKLICSWFPHHYVSFRIIMQRTLSSKEDSNLYIAYIQYYGHWWIPRTIASDAELLCFLWSAPE